MPQRFTKVMFGFGAGGSKVKPEEVTPEKGAAAAASERVTPEKGIECEVSVQKGGDTQASGEGGVMPPVARLSDEQVVEVAAWIEAGATSACD